MDFKKAVLIASNGHDAQFLTNTVEEVPRNPAFQMLLKGLIFSRLFVLTYNLALLLSFLSIATLRWCWRTSRKARQKQELRRWKESRSSGKNSLAEASRRDSDEAHTSYSSSTLTGTASPQEFDPNHCEEVEELTPLISRNRKNGRKRRALRASLSALLMYQPRPIPFINKTLPDNKTSILILILYSLNVFYSLFRIPMDKSALFIFADRVGLLFAANLPVLYLLAAKNQPIKRLTGCSYEALNIFHRRLGEMMCLLALLHAIGMFVIWYVILRPELHVSLIAFLLNKVVLLGLCALTAYELLYLTSLGTFRQRWYELFLASHVFLQLAAAVFLWFHYLTARIYVGTCILIFCMDRLLYRMALKTVTVEAKLSVMEDKETVMVSCNWAIPTMTRSGARRSILFGWQPTDHVYLTIPHLSSGDRLQAHPFTIASGSPDLADPEPHAWLSLLIRAQDGFSRRLLECAKSGADVQVILDGPYGSTTPLDTLRDSDLALVVAGGSGIAVAFPLLWALLHHNQNQDVQTEAVFTRIRRTTCLVWVVHSRSHLSWLPQERLKELRERGLQLCIPPPTVDGGRPDVGEIVRDLVYQHGCERSAVVVSGPDGMNRDVRNSCSRLVQEGLDVSIEVEKFGW